MPRTIARADHFATNGNADALLKSILEDQVRRTRSGARPKTGIAHRYSGLRVGDAVHGVGNIAIRMRIEEIGADDVFHAVDQAVAAQKRLRTKSLAQRASAKDGASNAEVGG
jgi:hypothetical protein